MTIRGGSGTAIPASARGRDGGLSWLRSEALLLGTGALSARLFAAGHKHSRVRPAANRWAWPTSAKGQARCTTLQLHRLIVGPVAEASPACRRFIPNASPVTLRSPWTAICGRRTVGATHEAEGRNIARSESIPTEGDNQGFKISWLGVDGLVMRRHTYETVPRSRDLAVQETRGGLEQAQEPAHVLVGRRAMTLKRPGSWAHVKRRLQ